MSYAVLSCVLVDFSTSFCVSKTLSHKDNPEGFVQECMEHYGC